MSGIGQRKFKIKCRICAQSDCSKDLEPDIEVDWTDTILKKSRESA